MQKSRLFYSIIPISLSLIFANSAIASTPFRDSIGRIHFQDFGLLAGAKITIDLATPKIFKRIPNNCGVLIVEPPKNTTPTSLTVDGVPISRSLVTLRSMPACVKNPVTGQFLKEPGSGSFVTIDGKVGILNKPIVPILYTWGGINQSKSLTANRCGFLKLSNTNLPVSFKFANTTYISASLAIRNPKLCIDGIKYVPII